jgi:hypothetical protein
MTTRLCSHFAEAHLTLNEEMSVYKCGIHSSGRQNGVAQHCFEDQLIFLGLKEFI